MIRQVAFGRHDLLRGEAIGGNGLIQGAAFDGNGLVTVVACLWCEWPYNRAVVWNILIRGVVICRSGLIREVLQ